jgi:hypothetical protein
MRAAIAAVILLAAGTAGAAPDLEHTSGPIHVAVTSNGRNVHLAIDVHAKLPALDLWLATARTPTTYVQAGAQLYLVDGKPDAAALAAELVHPSFSPCAEMVADGDPAELAGAVAQAQRDLLPDAGAKLGLVTAVVGQVHLGLFADGRPAVRYDRDGDRVLDPHVELAPIETFVTYRATPTADGFHVEATLSPDAFGFVPRGGLHAFDYRLAPAGGAPTTDTTPFETVLLAHPIGVDFAAGADTRADPWPPMMMRTAAGWAGVTRTVEAPSELVHGCRVTATRLQTVAFRVEPIALASSEQIGRARVRIYTLGDASSQRELIAVGRAAIIADDIVATAVLPDGTPAAIATTLTYYGNPQGYCGAGDVTELWLVRLGAQVDQVPLGELDPCRGAATLGELSLHIADDLPDHPFAWIRRGRSLRVHLAIPAEHDPDNDQPATLHDYAVSWDDHGDHVRAVQKM